MHTYSNTAMEAINNQVNAAWANGATSADGGKSTVRELLANLPKEIKTQYRNWLIDHPNAL
jgi:hypothetical protein